MSSNTLTVALKLTTATGNTSEVLNGVNTQLREIAASSEITGSQGTAAAARFGNAQSQLLGVSARLNAAQTLAADSVTRLTAAQTLASEASTRLSAADAENATAVTANTTAQTALANAQRVATQASERLAVATTNIVEAQATASATAARLEVATTAAASAQTAATQTATRLASAQLNNAAASTNLLEAEMAATAALESLTLAQSQASAATARATVVTAGATAGMSGGAIAATAAASAYGGLTTMILGFIGLATAKDILDKNRELESLRMRLVSVMHSAELATVVFDKMMKLDVTTPFGIQDLTAAFIKLKNFGLDPTDKVMKALTDTVAKLGGGADVLGGVALALGQSWAKAKLQAQDTNQMIERGVPVYEALSNVTGKNSTALVKMMENGELTRDVMAKMLLELGRMAEGSSARAMETLDGKISALGNSWTKFADALLQDKSEGWIKNFVTSVSDSIDYLTGKIRNVSPELETLSNKAIEIAKLQRNVDFMQGSVLGRAGFAITGTTLAGEINRLQTATAEYQRLNAEISKNKAGIDAQAKAQTDFAKATRDKADADSKLTSEQEAYQDFQKKYGNEQQKIDLELADWKTKLGSKYDAETEAVIRNTMAKKANGEANKAESELLKQQVDLLKTASDIQKSTTDQRIKDIERLTNAALVANNEAKKELDFQRELGNVSNADYYSQQAKIINDSFDRQIAAKQQEIELTHQSVAAQTQLTQGINATEQAEKALGKAGKDSLEQIKATASFKTLANAVLQQESAGNANAVSSKGAMGLMQVMPATAANPGYGIAPLQNNSAAENIRFGEDYLAAMLREFGGTVDKLNQPLTKLISSPFLSQGLAAYNAGAKTVKDAGGVPNIDETQNYVKDIIAKVSGTLAAVGLTSKSITEYSKDAVDAQNAEKQQTTELAQLEKDRQAALTDNARKQILDSRAYQKALDEEELKLIKLTKTTQEAQQAQTAFNLKYNTVYQQAVKSGDTKAITTFNQVSQAENIKADTQAAIAYQEQLNGINKGVEKIGLTSAQAFDLMNKGAGGVVTAFQSLTEQLGKVNEAIAKNALDAQKTANDSSLSEAQKAELAAAYTQKTIKLESEKTSVSLTGIRQVAGATAEMFGQNTAARQAFHDIEMALGGIELAYNLANNASQIAANAEMIASNVAVGASKIWGQMGIFAPIGLALMAASLVAYGVGAMGGSHIAQAPKASPDTGTVLGDSTKSSQSITNIVTTLKDINAQQYPELQGINRGVADLSTSLTASVNRIFQAGGLTPQGNTNYGLGDQLGYKFGDGLGMTVLSSAISGGLGLAVSAGISALAATTATQAVAGAASLASTSLLGSLAGPIGLLASGIFTALNLAFSGGYKHIDEYGIQTAPQKISDVAAGSSLATSQYNVIKTRQWDLFSDSTSYQTVTNGLNKKVEDSLTTVFRSAGNMTLALASQLGADVAQKAKNYVIPELKVNLTNLNADDASKKLNGVLSTALDNMATNVFGDIIGQYQQAGEGMLETATRIVSEIALVKDALGSHADSIKKDAVAISDAVVQAAGGLKAFSTQFSDYVDKFYTDSEKQNRLQSQLTTVLSSVNEVLPTTRDGYRALVDSLDLTNAKDRERYSLLLQSASAADKYYASLESGLKTLQDSVKSAYDTANSLLSNQINTYKNYVDSFKQLSDSLLKDSASPLQSYQQSKAAFEAVKRTLELKTASDTEKETALSKLSTVTQDYMTASKAYNASGMGYVKDFAEAQGLLASQISASQTKVDVAQQQLDAATKQVTALGVLDKSLTTVSSALDALTTAINNLNAEKLAQQASANQAAWAKAENTRKASYDAPIEAQATSYAAKGQSISSHLPSLSNVSKRAWSMDASFDVANNQTSSFSANSASHNAGSVVATLQDKFPAIQSQFVAAANAIKSIIGSGALPEVKLHVTENSASYSMGGKSSQASNNALSPLITHFASDATELLAEQMSDKTWAAAVKGVSFDSLANGLSALETTIEHLKNPYVATTYNPKTDYVHGSHKNGLARVPYDGYIAELHAEEGVLTAGENDFYHRLMNTPTQPPAVIINHVTTTDNSELVAELRALIAEVKDSKVVLEEQNDHAAAGVVVGKNGFQRLIKATEKLAGAAEQTARRQRINENA